MTNRLRNGWTIDGETLVSPSGHHYRPDEPVTAAEIAECLGIPEHVTRLFNHSGSVPAAHVVREARQRREREENEVRGDYIRIRLTAAEKAALQARAEAEGKTIASLIRDTFCQ
ncbi:MAG TPA: hypothetical protein VFU47_03850 [Armatimonadota bacterium]|nr:hypothetical protein [Armatimonadota bacterium]